VLLYLRETLLYLRETLLYLREIIFPNTHAPLV